jgi:hypothetical protein
MPGIVDSYALGFPAGWVSWTVGQGSERADELSAKAADAPEAKEIVHRGGSVIMAKISGITYGASKDWVRWAPGEGSAVAADLAAGVSENAQVQALLRRAIEGFDRTVAGQPGVWGAGLWVPEPESREPLADMVVRVVDPDDEKRIGVQDYLRLCKEPPRRRGVKQFNVSVSEATLPAGPAVLQVSDEMQHRWSRVVSMVMRWAVFPENTEQMVVIDFRTAQPALFDPLSLETNDITDSLVVELAQS